MAALEPGNVIHVRQKDDRRVLLDQHEREIGRLAAKFTLPEGKRIVGAAVASVIVREKDDSDPEYHPSLRCESWEVVLPELNIENE